MQDWSQYKPATFEYMSKWIKNWFSNMVLSPISFNGTIYNSVENFYQAMKTKDLDERRRIAMLTPSQSKQAGKKVVLRDDWESIKYTIMLMGLKLKFEQHPELKAKLLATGDETLIEWNNWGDKIWGVTINDCKGQNLLGKALMEVREALK